MLLIVTVFLAGCGAPAQEKASGPLLPPAATAALAIPPALTEAGLNLRAGPVAAVFAHLDRLRPGDPIIVHDTRTALDVRLP
jgi:hypothetical protein